MPKPDTNRLLEDLDNRQSNIQQILPTLATKDELQAAIALLATKEELRAAIAPLATREEMHAAIAAAVAPLPTRDEMRTAIRAEGEETRRHFDVVAESIRTEVRIIAGLDRRVLRLETERSR